MQKSDIEIANIRNFVDKETLKDIKKESKKVKCTCPSKTCLLHPR